MAKDNDSDGPAPAPSAVWPATRVSPGASQAIAATVAEEVPVALVYNGTSHAVMIASPADLEDLGLGFSLSEGILQSPSELLDSDWRRTDQGIELSLTITQRRFAGLAERRRTLAGRTGCGLCGVDSLNQVVRPVASVGGAGQIAASSIRRALAALRDKQTLSRATGAVHGAAWVSADGDIELVREDVGRHNALDKLLGAMVRRNIEPRSGFIVLTSRCSFEMVQKAATCGVGFLVAISAPTAMALRLAEQAGMTVVALARSDNVTVYTHRERLLAD